MEIRGVIVIMLGMVASLPNAVSYTMDDAKRLMEKKLTGYEKTFRPLHNQSAPLYLFTAMELLAIQEFDELQEKLKITAVIVLNWLDEYMIWDPEDFGGMDELFIENTQVWTPNLVLTNNVDKLEKIGGDEWQFIRFNNEGISFYYPGQVFSASCNVDVTYYPWDRHVCHFSFSVWAHGEDEIVLVPSLEKVQTTWFSPNGAWTFHKSEVETYFGGTTLNFYLHLERKPRFLLINVLLPIVFMTFLNILIFFIPIESGERISYSITMLLAIAVFLTLVGDNLPKTSNPMSIFSYYLLAVLIISIFITLVNIASVRIYHIDESDPVPGWLASFTRCIRCRCSGSRRNRKVRKNKRGTNSSRKRDSTYKHSNNSSIKRDNIYENDRSDNNGFHGFSDVVFYMGKDSSNRGKTGNMYLPERKGHTDFDYEKNDTQATPDSGDDLDVTWKDVSVAVDVLVFIICLLVLIAVTLVFFLFLLLGSRRENES